MYFVLFFLLFVPALILSAPNVPREGDDRFLEEKTEKIRLHVGKKFNNYEVRVHKDHEPDSTLYRLNLSPSPSPFTSNFVLKHIDVDQNGKLVFLEERISEAKNLNNIASEVFVDAENGATVRLRNHPTNNQFTIEGILNDQRISWEDSAATVQHFLHSTDKVRQKREIEEVTTSPPEVDDVLDEHRPLIAGRAPPGMTIVASPELVFLFDYENSKQFNWDQNKILDYASILVNELNNRFSTNSDILVTFTLAGIVTTKSKEAEKHYEKAKNGSHYSSSKLLEAFTYWAYENKKDLGKYDILPVLTTVPLEGTTAGVAYVESACWNRKSPTEDRDMSVALIKDVGGLWTGAGTAAHELAHTLGVPHDGIGKAKDCPWSDGFMMSYEGWGSLNKYRFSSCSQKNMREFVVSSGGTCLTSDPEEKNLVTSSDPLGKRVTMNDICKKVTEKKDVTVMDDDPDAQCRMIRCKYAKGEGVFLVQTVPMIVGTDTPCGKGGKCKDGFCVGNQQKPIVDQKEKDAVCAEKMKNPNATSLDTSDLPPNNQCTSLKCKIPAKGGYSWMSVDVFLGNGAPCNKIGKCTAGKCV